MNKYEKLIEYIINDEESKARELFHEIVVEKSRDIYESLMDTEESIGGNPVDSLVDEISADEEGIAEDDLEGDEELDLGDEVGADDEMDFDGNGDLDSHEEEHASDEDRISDLEDALDELKAEFDKLMSAEAGEEEHAGEFGDEMGSDEMGDSPEVEESVFEAEDCDDEEDEEDKEDKEVKESAKSDIDLMREYVEKVAMPSNKSEGGEVGKGGSTSVNKQSIVAKKNDMGGTTANIVKGGEEKGMQAKAKGEFTGQFQNKPGAKADLSKAQAPKKGEESGTNSKSIEG